MQLLQECKGFRATAKDFSVNITANVIMKDAPSDNLAVKEKPSSDASVPMMNPVASGDNVTTGLNLAHKEELPPLVPCCEGRELQISEDLIHSGLSAISVKHDSVIHSLSMSRACERMQIPPGLVKHRNSFRCLHRPDLKRVPYLRRMSPDELQSLFRGYADLPARGTAIDDRDKTRELSGGSKETRPDTGKEANQENSTPLNPILEIRAGSEDVPAGMRLHGARARLYTSVLAGAKAGDQSDTMSTNEDYDHHIPDDTLPEDEVQLNEELQIILPPRCDEITADCSITTTSSDKTS